MSSIHYKFRATLEYKTLQFDGLHITASDLVRQICTKENIKIELFDLKLENSHTKKKYEGDDLIPRNSSITVQRVPRAEAMKVQKVQSGVNSGIVTAAETSSSNNTPEINSAEFEAMDEDERLKHVKDISTRAYDASNFRKKVGGGIMSGPPPPTYTCNRCYQPGHWYKNCPMLNTKRTTGIPSHELMETTSDDPAAMLHPSGKYVMSIMHWKARQENRKQEEATGQTARVVPPELKCPICGELIKEAVLTACCGNSFCGECITQKIIDSEDKKCPGEGCKHTQVSVDALIPNKLLRQAADNWNAQGTAGGKEPEHVRIRIGLNKPAVVTTLPEAPSTSPKVVPVEIPNVSQPPPIVPGGGAPMFTQPPTLLTNPQTMTIPGTIPYGGMSMPMMQQQIGMPMQQQLLPPIPGVLYGNQFTMPPPLLPQIPRPQVNPETSLDMWNNFLRRKDEEKSGRRKRSSSRSSSDSEEERRRRRRRESDRRDKERRDYHRREDSRRRDYRDRHERDDRDRRSQGDAAKDSKKEDKSEEKRERETKEDKEARRAEKKKRREERKARRSRDVDDDAEIDKALAEIEQLKDKRDEEKSTDRTEDEHMADEEEVNVGVRLEEKNEQPEVDPSETEVSENHSPELASEDQLNVDIDMDEPADSTPDPSPVEIEQEKKESTEEPETSSSEKKKQKKSKKHKKDRKRDKSAADGEKKHKKKHKKDKKEKKLTEVESTNDKKREKRKSEPLEESEPVKKKEKLEEPKEPKVEVVEQKKSEKEHNRNEGRHRDDREKEREEERRRRDRDSDRRRSKEERPKSKEEEKKPRDEKRRSKDDGRRPRGDEKKSRDEEKKHKSEEKRPREEERKTKEEGKKSKDDSRRTKDLENGKKDDRKSTDSKKGKLIEFPRDEDEEEAHPSREETKKKTNEKRTSSHKKDEKRTERESSKEETDHGSSKVKVTKLLNRAMNDANKESSRSKKESSNTQKEAKKKEEAQQTFKRTKITFNL